MCPTKTMALRILKTSVNLSCTSEGVQWKPMTTVTDRVTHSLV